MSGGQSGQQARNPDLKALGTKSIGKRKASCFFQDFQTAHSFSWGLGGFEVKLERLKNSSTCQVRAYSFFEVHKEGKNRFHRDGEPFSSSPAGGAPGAAVAGCNTLLNRLARSKTLLRKKVKAFAEAVTLRGTIPPISG